MTDKIIINGIDVSESVLTATNNNICYSQKAVDELQNDIKRLQEENEELKKYIKDLQVRKDRYYLQLLEFEKQISDWVTFYIKISNIISGNYEILDSQGLQDLRRIVNEVLNDRD